VTSTILASIPSPSQGVWHLWIFPIRAYALCIVAGIIAALVIGDRRWAARGGERGVIYDIALWAVPFGLVGGRLYHVITDWSTYFSEGGAGLAGALRIWDGGLGIWGAVALGGVGAWLGCRRAGIPLPAFGDAIAPGIILAQAIGRLGNYFNQELYGRETDMPWGLIIYDRENAAGQRDMLNGVSTGVPLFEHPVHPTFLYELLWNVLVFAVLLWADKRFKLGHGRLFALYVAGYCLGRFWVELMRSDYATLIAGIRVNTFTSTFVFIGAVIYVMAAKKGREDPETLRGKDAEPLETDAAVPAVVGTGAVAAAGVTASDAGDGPYAEQMEPDSDETDAGEAEPESEVAAEADDLADALDEVSDEELADAATVAEQISNAPERAEGLGSVDDEDVAEAEVLAPEVHEAAVEAAEEAEALAEDVADESDQSAETGEPDPSEDSGEAAESAVEGLGAVEGDEVAEAAADAPEVHEAAVEAAEEAEATADEVAESDEPEAEAPATEEPEREAEDAEADESGAELSDDAEPVEGLGAVEGDEVAAAAADASEVHEAAVDSAEEAEATADEVAAQPDAESESEEVSEAGESAAEPDEADVEDAEAVAETDDEAETDADEAAESDEPEPADEPEPEPVAPRATVEPAPVAEEPRKRWWRRNS
jgi:prolipoprotein diacylglyceryl transferase